MWWLVGVLLVIVALAEFVIRAAGFLVLSVLTVGMIVLVMAEMDWDPLKPAAFSVLRELIRSGRY